MIEFLIRVFSREGFPQEIVTDNGVQFKSDEFEQFCKERGIKHTYSSLYYPQANGAVERFNAVLKTTVQNAVNQKKSWKDCVTQFLGIYRATAHATTGCPPSVLLHGRQMRTRLNVIGSSLPKIDVERVRERVKENQNKYKQRCDDKHVRKPVNLQVGDWVHVKRPGIVRKGDRMEYQ